MARPRLFATTPTPSSSGEEKVRAWEFRNSRTGIRPSRPSNIQRKENKQNKPLAEVLSCDLDFMKLLLHVAFARSLATNHFCKIPSTQLNNSTLKHFQFHFSGRIVCLGSEKIFLLHFVHSRLWLLIKISPDNLMTVCRNSGCLIKSAFECCTLNHLAMNHHEIFFFLDIERFHTFDAFLRLPEQPRSIKHAHNLATNARTPITA